VLDLTWAGAVAANCRIPAEQAATPGSPTYRHFISLATAASRFGATAGPAPDRGAATKDQFIVITITLPEGADAQVQVTKHRDSPPPGPAVPATAG